MVISRKGRKAGGSDSSPDLQVTSLPISERIIEVLLEQGITELYPPQARGLKVVFDDRNLVLAVPTSSGKSLVAYIACLRAAISGNKALYIVPLKALAQEKYEDLLEFERLGIKVGVAVGDPNETSEGALEQFDIVVATSEKVDAMLRHKIGWLREIKVLVSDEVHLINDPGRGPTLEVLLARIRYLIPEVQIIALSATIPNSSEIALWLDAGHVKDDFRPVPLKEGVLEGTLITFTDNTTRKVPQISDPVTSLVTDVIKEGGQSLIFVNSRRSAESLAHKLTGQVNVLLDPKTRETCMNASKDLKAREGEKTTMGVALRTCLDNGVAFHHAGLSSTQRRTVEQAFKAGHLKAIAATPTLAAGINLPARRVIIRDVFRYGGTGGGMVPIPNMEIKQMAGRAGRPRYDPYGEAVLIARTPDQRDQFMEEILNGPVEEVTSKLADQAALRMHSLGSVATGYIRTLGGLKEFFASTFYAHNGDMYVIESELVRAVDFLLNEDLVEKIEEEGEEPKPEREETEEEKKLREMGIVTADILFGRKYDDDMKLQATEFGNVTSHLYIDPSSAVTIRDALRKWPDLKEPPTLFPILHAICYTTDVFSFNARQRDVDTIEKKLLKHEEELLIELPDIGTEEYHDYLAAAKTAMLLEDWCSEIAEDNLCASYSVGPGDIWNLTDTSAWLLSAMMRLQRLFPVEEKDLIHDAYLRVRNGVKEELLPHVKLKGIGRVRARNLYKHGFTTIDKLKDTDYRQIAAVPSIGAILAAKIKEQLGISVSQQKRAEAMADDAEGLEVESEDSDKKGPQKSLFDF